jgi:hypothetical protein
LLVFGELAGQSASGRFFVIGGSLVMTVGAVAISFAVAPDAEQAARQVATSSECERYGLNVERVESALTGNDPLALEAPGRRWWDGLILVAAVGIFFLLLVTTEWPPFSLNARWVAVLVLVMLGSLFACGYLLWKRTRFS